MKNDRILTTLAAMLLACIVCVALCGSAGAQTLSIVNTSIDYFTAPQARDGVTLRIGYEITSTGNTTAQLSASLKAPNGQNVADMGDTANNNAPLTVNVATGTYWYYRMFLINLPPAAQTGSNVFYDITYAVKWGSNTFSYPLLHVIKMLPPVPVRVPILMYHKVGDALYSQYWNTTSMLQTQMAALKAYGYTAITCRELMDIRAGISQPPNKPVMITFDGGYQNFYTDALPVMMAYDYRPVMFLLTGIMGQDNSWDGDNNPVIMFMTWAEVDAAYNTGYVDLESHTVTHPDLVAATASTRNKELTDSRNIIHNRYGCPCDFFCYPYGSYNTAVKQAVRDNNYFAAFAAWGGVETTSADKYALKRVPIYWDTITDYDPAKPASFFFKEIGDPMVIPSITINSVQFVDPDTGSAITQLQWGQTVKIRVTATNSGSTADAGCSLSLTNATTGTVYDSHATSPARDVSITAWAGQHTFDFFYTVPIDTPTGVQYSAKVYFRDRLYVLGFKAPVSYNAFTITSNLINLQDAKRYSDATWASIKGAIVTAASFPDFFYIEMPNRSQGIRVERIAHGLIEGQKVDVAGAIINSPITGERCIESTYVFVNATTGSVAPLALPNSSIGGSAFNHQDQIWRSQHSAWVRGTGLNNTGLLVRTCGRVISVNASARTLVINDGSGGDLKCVWPEGVNVAPSWTYATVTGVSSCEIVSGQLHPVLLVTSAQGP